MANTSRSITCNREYGAEVCGNPIAPVLGAWPEECTQCATRILTTREGFEVAERITDATYGMLRSLVIAAEVAGNAWAVKNTHIRFQTLDKFVARIGSRRLMMRMSIARRLEAQRMDASGRLVQEPRRESLGHRWTNVTQERAFALKHAGFTTRFIGVSWQVELS